MTTDHVAHHSRLLILNIKSGLRSAFFLRIAPNDKNASWSQLIFLTFINLAVQFVLDFMHVGLNGRLSLYGLPGILFNLPIILLAAWAIASLANQSEKILSLLIVFSAISLPCEVFPVLLQWVLDLRFPHALLRHWANQGNHIMIGWYALACGVAAIRLVEISKLKKVSALLLALVIIGVPLSQIYRDQMLWTTPYDESTADNWNKRNNPLATEDIFYLQPQLLEHELAAVQPSRPGGAELFFVGMAGYSDQDVFMTEVRYVDSILKKRFGTSGHSVMLINNPKTVTQSPIASATSLQLSLKRVGTMMDRNKDILFLYLTSHGSKDHKFSLDFGMMQFNDLYPKRLKEILDASGIKHRIIVVSACYSGGFIDELKNENTFVITSAAPDRTSFGCSNDANLTYFGKAYFDEALRKTDSFIDAFYLAKPIIASREKENDFTPSDPRVFIGEKIKLSLIEFNRQRSATRIADAVAAYHQPVPSAAQVLKRFDDLNSILASSDSAEVKAGKLKPYCSTGFSLHGKACDAGIKELIQSGVSTLDQIAAYDLSATDQFDNQVIPTDQNVATVVIQDGRRVALLWKKAADGQFYIAGDGNKAAFIAVHPTARDWGGPVRPTLNFDISVNDDGKGKPIADTAIINGPGLVTPITIRAIKMDTGRIWNNATDPWWSLSAFAFNTDTENIWGAQKQFFYDLKMVQNGIRARTPYVITLKKDGQIIAVYRQSLRIAPYQSDYKAGMSLHGNETSVTTSFNGTTLTLPDGTTATFPKFNNEPKLMLAKGGTYKANLIIPVGHEGGFTVLSFLETSSIASKTLDAFGAPSSDPITIPNRPDYVAGMACADIGTVDERGHVFVIQQCSSR